MAVAMAVAMSTSMVVRRAVTMRIVPVRRVLPTIVRVLMIIVIAMIVGALRAG